MFGGPGPVGMREDIELVDRFDMDDDGRLDAAERAEARKHLAEIRADRPGGGRFGPPRGFADASPPEPGGKLSPREVATYSDAPLYAPDVLRTLFIEFEAADWERELSDFYGTDVDVPATLVVDGETVSDVGIHFRGASSYFTVSQGRKRSLNLSIDFVRGSQRLARYRTLNLLNSHMDPTFLRTVLYFHIAREYIPAPQANYVRVAINGENWGVYVNSQQFNKDFLEDWFGTKKGVRWKVPGSPRGKGGLEYLGDDLEDYRQVYELKTGNDPRSWTALVHLCRVLNQTAPAELESALEPLLDIDGALMFLALENVFINNDGYWIRASDYNLYLDKAGRFHVVPHDANETFRMPGGPGFGRRMSVRGVELDPLTGIDDPRKPLLHKLLAVPELRARYLGFVRTLAEEWLDWDRLAPLVASYQKLIADEVERDTRRLDSFEAFRRGVTEDIEEQGFRGPRRSLGLKSFAQQRRAYLLDHPDVMQAIPQRPAPPRD